MDYVYRNGRRIAVEPRPTPAAPNVPAARGPTPPRVQPSRVTSPALRVAPARESFFSRIFHPRAAVPARVAAHEAAAIRAWRPAWGARPLGFGAARWRPEWGRQPAWFGARQWRTEWGAQPAWWTTHLTMQAAAPPEDGQPPAPPSAGSDASQAPPASPSDATAPSDSASAAPDGSAPDGASDAASAPAGGAAPAAAEKPGLSTLAKVGIAAGAVAVVGGVAALVIRK